MTVPAFTDAATNAVMKATLSRVYTYLINAAAQQQLVFTADVQEVMFGMKATKFSADCVEAMNSVLAAIAARDISSGRAPLTALIIVRNNGNYCPPRGFFSQYQSLTGTELSNDAWKQLVRNIYESYSFGTLDPNMPDVQIDSLEKSYRNFEKRMSGGYKK